MRGVALDRAWAMIACLWSSYHEEHDGQKGGKVDGKDTGESRQGALGTPTLLRNNRLNSRAKK